MSTALMHLSSNLAAKFGMADSEDVLQTLKATAFRGQVSDAQMTALLIVANQYGLNPWTKEIYAFPDKNNGIVPVVGVDGWARIINDHPQFDGMEFEQTEDACTCIIYRKDRSRPVRVTEYMAECKRTNAPPWISHPLRMLRHKAMIQCARLAFGYGGIYEQDEAERIVEGVLNPEKGDITRSPERPTLEPYPADRFAELLPSWREPIQSGKKTPEEIIIMVSKRGSLSEEQKKSIRDLAVIDAEYQEIDPFVAEMEAAE